MFGLVNANWSELTQDQRQRYSAVYCGICQEIGQRTSGLARVVLSYDMAFLALLHMSLYEPAERQGSKHCAMHPVKPRPWVDNSCVQYAADMNVALAYYKALDDAQDDGKRSAKLLAAKLEGFLPRIRQQWPRQCQATESCIQQLNRLEKENTADVDLPASCFGQLMAELLVLHQDQWQQPLRAMGFSLGRFLYLADAVMDYDRDVKKGRYNPIAAMGRGKAAEEWEEYLVLAMARCTESFEKLPLVQDKALLDNILYSGVWVQYRGKRRKEEPNGKGSL